MRRNAHEGHNRSHKSYRSHDQSGATFDLWIGGSEIASVAYDTAISGGDWDGWKFTSVDGTLKFANLA